MEGDNSTTDMVTAHAISQSIPLPIETVVKICGYLWPMASADLKQLRLVNREWKEAVSAFCTHPSWRRSRRRPRHDQVPSAPVVYCPASGAIGVGGPPWWYSQGLQHLPEIVVAYKHTLGRGKWCAAYFTVAAIRYKLRWKRSTVVQGTGLDNGLDAVLRDYRQWSVSRVANSRAYIKSDPHGYLHKYSPEVYPLRIGQVTMYMPVPSDVARPPKLLMSGVRYDEENNGRIRAVHRWLVARCPQPPEITSTWRPDLLTGRA
jgi:hypothetical protein